MTPGKWDAMARACRFCARILPQSGGMVDSVTVLNLSIGRTGPVSLRIRNPASTVALYQSPEMDAPVPISSTLRSIGHVSELLVTLPNLAPWQIATVFLAP